MPIEWHAIKTEDAGIHGTVRKVCDERKPAAAHFNVLHRNEPGPELRKPPSAVRAFVNEPPVFASQLFNDPLLERSWQRLQIFQAIHHVHWDAFFKLCNHARQRLFRDRVPDIFRVWVVTAQLIFNECRREEFSLCAAGNDSARACPANKGTYVPPIVKSPQKARADHFSGLR